MHQILVILQSKEMVPGGLSNETRGICFGGKLPNSNRLMILLR